MYFAGGKVFQKFLSDAVKIGVFLLFSKNQVFALDEIKVWVYNRGVKIKIVL